MAENMIISSVYTSWVRLVDGWAGYIQLVIKLFCRQHAATVVWYVLIQWSYGCYYYLLYAPQWTSGGTKYNNNEKTHGKKFINKWKEKKNSLGLLLTNMFEKRKKEMDIKHVYAIALGRRMRSVHRLLHAYYEWISFFFFERVNNNLFWTP